MNEMYLSEKERLVKQLDQLQLGGWLYFDEIGSTNDAALEWASGSAADWSLVVADSQTKGRGRNERQWITRPGAALALSLILRPAENEKKYITRFTALGALGVVDALGAVGLQAEVKWPNDVLLAGRKVAGILVESDWQGENPLAVVIGIGVNIRTKAVPDEDTVRYPATSVETEFAKSIDRWGILSEIIRSMQKLRPLINSDDFIKEWNRNLAFHNEWIVFKPEGRPAERMRIERVTDDGRLSLTKENGERVETVSGEIVFNRGI